MIVSSKSLGDPIDQGKVLIGLYIPKLSPCLKMEVYLEGKYFEKYLFLITTQILDTIEM